MTAADGRATDAALGQSGTATPATPRHAAPHGQPSRMSEPPAGRSGSAGAVVGGAAGADSPPARRSASADARAGGPGPSGDSAGRGLSASAPRGGVASTDNGTGEAVDAGTPAGGSTPAHPQAGRSSSAEPGPGPAQAFGSAGSAGPDTPAVRPGTATNTETAPQTPSSSPVASGSPAASGTPAPAASGAPASGGPAAPAPSGSPVASGPRTPSGPQTPSGTETPSGTPTTAPPGTPPPVDTMAAVVRQWQAVHPGIDTGPMEIIGRINRSAALLQQAEDAPLRRAGLTRPEFDVLGTLRRTGHELTPSEIARETFSSGAAVTKRLKQLTERGLVERRGDTRDRRVAHVRLTDAGRDLVDGILPQQLAYETTALSGIDLARQRELADLLGELLGQLEGRLGVPRV